MIKPEFGDEVVEEDIVKKLEEDFSALLAKDTKEAFVNKIS